MQRMQYLLRVTVDKRSQWEKKHDFLGSVYRTMKLQFFFKKGLNLSPILIKNIKIHLLMLVNIPGQEI